MLTIRKSAERGSADHGWLQTKHSFSFADYYDPHHMGWGNLRVINEDRVAPATGFGTHGHRDMEIVTYVLDGVLEHRDSMGNHSQIRPNEVQRMSAGTGVRHSEMNPEAAIANHFLQIWILPDTTGITPGYEQKTFTPQEKRGRLRLLASPTGEDGSVRIHADARLYGALLDGDEAVTLPLDPQRKAYVYLARGTLTANGQPLSAGDALLLGQESQVALAQGEGAEVLVFDLKA